MQDAVGRGDTVIYAKSFSLLKFVNLVDRKFIFH
jgi:hypothetical protein